ncbi:MAG: hypothetical protein H0X67_03110 [Acidobacteria bacterium]|nr:hypothetical protein [Acidobacteriota bacterium]
MPVGNAVSALGDKEAISRIRQRQTLALEEHLKGVPEDARARTLLSVNYAMFGRPDEATLALSLRPTEATVRAGGGRARVCARPAEPDGPAVRRWRPVNCG